MSEAIDLASQESGNEVPAEEDDRLLTTRLPPIQPPPMRPPSVPPPASATPTIPPSMPPSFAPSGTYRSDGQPTNSWWRALLATTLPPQAPSVVPELVPESTAEDRERLLRRRIGATCAGMAIGFVILALALGLRGAEPAYSPAVAAAVVVSRSIVALGFLGFGYALLRMAERVLTGRSERSLHSSSRLD
jgi:hypothetical protein